MILLRLSRRSQWGRIACAGAAALVSLAVGSSCGASVEPMTVDLVGTWRLSADYHTPDGGATVLCRWRDVPLTVRPGSAPDEYYAPLGPGGTVRCRGADGEWSSGPGGFESDRGFRLLRTGDDVALYEVAGVQLHGSIGRDGAMRGTLTLPPYVPADPFSPELALSGTWVAWRE